MNRQLRRPTEEQALGNISRQERRDQQLSELAMKTDRNGCSTCERGQEQWDEYYSSALRAYRVQYDYRTPDGRLFSCIGKTLEDCRRRRDAWLAQQQ